MQMGARVIIASRTHDKCLATADNFRKQYSESPGVLETMALDTSDLISVKAFVAWFHKDHKQLDFLVNNAGILYLPTDPMGTPENPLQSKQGYDKCFATNYLGHFLLTHLLLPTLKSTPSARILFVSSSSHLQVDGSGLRPTSNGGKLGRPNAARSDIYTSAHWITAYANSKLAQILHMNVLQKIITQDPKSNNLKVI